MKIINETAKQIHPLDLGYDVAVEHGETKDFYFQGAIRGGHLLGEYWYTSTGVGCFRVEVMS
jgi:hypothetical protein